MNAEHTPPATACGRQQPDSPGPALTPTPTPEGRQIGAQREVCA